VDELLEVGQKAHRRLIASRSCAPQVLSRFVLGSPDGRNCPWPIPESTS